MNAKEKWIDPKRRRAWMQRNLRVGACNHGIRALKRSEA